MCNERWGNGQQSDAQEFMRSLLDMLHAELNRSEGRVPFKSLSGKGTESQQARLHALLQFASPVAQHNAGRVCVCAACTPE